MSTPDVDSQRMGEPDSARDQTYAAQLIASCNAAMRTLRLHHGANEAVLKLVGTLQQSLEMLREHHPARIVLVYVEGVYYLGDHRVRLSPAQEPIAEQLARELVRRGIGGFGFDGVRSQEEILTFFSVLEQNRDRQNVEALRKDLRDKGIKGITVSSVLRPITDGEKSGEKKVSSHAADVFSLAIRHMASSLRDKTAMASNARGKRIVQEFVDLAEKDPILLMSLAGLRGTGSDDGEHTIAVSTLSIALGMRMGLTRNLLADLGYAALQHDAALPDLGPDHVADIARHPVRALRALGAGALDVRQMRQIASSFEHHRDYVGGGEPRILGAPRPHLFSLIIRIANDFDGFTRGRRGAEPVDVPEAIARLYRGRSSAYHPQLVDLFADIVGGVDVAPAAPPTPQAGELDLMLAAFLGKQEEVEVEVRATAKPAPPAKKNALGVLKLKKLAKKRN